MSSIHIIEVKSELGAGTRGASLGVDAIQIAGIARDDKFFKDKHIRQVEVENHLLLGEKTPPYAFYIDGLIKVYNRVCGQVSQSLGEDAFPLVLAGDHSTAGGTIAGIKQAFPNKRLGVIWIDAHADLHSPYTTPSGNMHGMPVATALGLDNLENKREGKDEQPGEEACRGWETLKQTGGINPKVLPQDLVYIAVRSTEVPEDNAIASKGIKLIRVAEVRTKGAARIVTETLEALAETDIIYVSFDVDSLDSNISVGTGTPEPDGLEIAEAHELVYRLVASPKTVCFELVEVNPLLDLDGNKMAGIAFEMVKEVYNIVQHKQANGIQDNA